MPGQKSTFVNQMLGAVTFGGYGYVPPPAPPSGDGFITEGGDPLIAENGDRLIPE